MQRDDASAKMAYDAHREQFYKFYELVMARMPEMRDAWYAWGYRRGLDDAMRFHPVHLEPGVPPELDGTHAESWAGGYGDGEMIGREYRLMLLRKSDIGSQYLL